MTDLKEVRELLYKMQRPGIAPEVSAPFLSDSLLGTSQIKSSRLLDTPTKTLESSGVKLTTSSYTPRIGKKAIWCFSTIGGCCTRWWGLSSLIKLGCFTRSVFPVLVRMTLHVTGQTKIG